MFFLSLLTFLREFYKKKPKIVTCCYQKTLEKHQIILSIPYFQLVTDLELYIATKVREAAAAKTTVQPFIVSLGTKLKPEYFFTVINGSFESHKTLFAALKHLFALFWLYDLKYPRLSSSFFFAMEMLMYQFTECSGQMCFRLKRLLALHQALLKREDVGAGDGAKAVGAGDGAKAVGAGDGAKAVGAGDGAKAVGAGDGAKAVGAGDGDPEIQIVHQKRGGLQRKRDDAAGDEIEAADDEAVDEDDDEEVDEEDDDEEDDDEEDDDEEDDDEVEEQDKVDEDDEDEESSKTGNKKKDARDPDDDDTDTDATREEEESVTTGSINDSDDDDEKELFAGPSPRGPLRSVP